MTVIILILIVYFSAFIQAISGFGLTLIAMPLITIVIGIKPAAPLVALIGLTVFTIILIRHRRHIRIKELIPLILSSIIGIPIGIWALDNLDEAIIKPLLGFILIVYAVYTFMRPKSFMHYSPWWVYPTGFLAGCLGSAYNTPGPPVIVYGSLRQWPKEEFRAVLQAFFFFNAVLVVLSHYLAGHLTRGVMTSYLYTLPFIFAGIISGSLVDRKIDHDRFLFLVTAMILILGLVLALSIWL